MHWHLPGWKPSARICNLCCGKAFVFRENRGLRTLFLDVDTQLDFMVPAGALYVPGAEQIVCKIAALNTHAAAQGHMLVSTVDAHMENDPEFLRWPAHCVTGTIGQQKPAATMPAGYQRHVMLRKQVLDAFASGDLDRLIAAFQPERSVVYGVVTEICVEFAVAGLRKFGGRIEVVTDAIRALDQTRAETLMQEWQSSGVTLVTSGDLLQ